MKITKNRLLLWLFLIFIMGYYTIDTTNISIDDVKGLLYLGMFFGIIKIYNSFRLDLKTVLALLLLSGIIIFIFLRNRDSRMLVALIAMFCGIKEEPKEIISVMFYTKILVFFMVMFMGGYGHINGVAIHFGMILLLYICMRQDCLKIREYFILIIAYLVIVLYTKSGSAVVGIGTAMFSLLLIKTEIGKKLYSSKIIMFIYPICLFLNYFFAAGIGEDEMPFIGDRLDEMPFIGERLSDVINMVYINTAEWLDVVTSHRLTLVKYSFARFGVSLLGGNVNYNLLDLGPNGYFNLDSGMIWLLQGWGILMTVVYMILSIMLMKYLIETKQYNYVIAGLVIALWAMNEDIIVSIGTNFLMVFMGQAMLYNVKGSAKNEHT